MSLLVFDCMCRRNYTDVRICTRDQQEKSMESSDLPEILYVSSDGILLSGVLDRR